MKNKPVVNVDFKFFRYNLKKFLLDFYHVFTHGEFSTVRNTVDVGVDGYCRPAKA